MLVVGVGNDLRGDDAVGLAVARRVKESGCGACVAMLVGDAADLVELMRGEDGVAIVDAVAASGCAGRVHRIDASIGWTGPRQPEGSTHALGVAEAIALARTLGYLPARVVVFGIEGVRFAVGDEMSREVREAGEAVVNEVMKEVASSASRA
ncbi:MAG: hydrogenase maturation protease [Acidobacteria bacterium]|nr:hydrogenase maturation protease [Acidobacteriota bacterium]